MSTNGAGAGAFLMAEALSGERPRTTLTILQGRARRSRLVAESLADYIAARSELEEAYVKGLQKLQRKPIIAESYGLHLGEGLERLRQRFDTELEETLQLHDGFQQKLDKDVVGVLRDKARAGEAALKQHDTAAAPLVKDWDDMKARLEKAQGKGAQNAAKVMVAQQDIVQAQQTWRTAVAPQLFTAYDQADRTRIEATKECLAKFATSQNDLGRDSMDIAARVLNDVILWELDEDISDWLRSEGGGRGGVLSGLQQGDRFETVEPASSESNLSPAVAAARTTSSMERTPSVHSGRNERSGGLLSKLRPAINRQRSSSRADAYGSIDMPGQDDNSLYSTDVPEGRTPLGRSTASRIANAPGEDTLGDMSFSSSMTRDDKRRSFMPSLMRRKNSTAQDRKGAGSKASTSFMPPPVDQEVSEVLATDAVNVSSRGSSMPLSATRSGPPPAVDSEGYSVPPEGHNKQPWSPGPGSASLMDDDDDAASHMRASSLAIQPSMVHESSNERQAALDKVKSTLLSSAPSGSVGRRGTARDRRAVRSAMFTSSDDGDSSRLTNGAAVPTALQMGNSKNSAFQESIGSGAVISPTRSPFANPAQTASDNAISPTLPETPLSPALRTPYTTQSQASPVAASGSLLGAFDQPHADGLRAAITETVQILVKGDSIERISVKGEVSLLLRSAEVSPMRIRLGEGAVLQRSSPNTAYISPVAGSTSDYTVNVGALSSVTVAAPVAVFRYAHTIAGTASNDILPVRIHPQWRCEPTQTSILVNYEAVSSSSLAGGSMLQDVALDIPISSSSVSGVQTKPHGDYLGDKGTLHFKLDDLDVVSRLQHKVLARLTVGEQSEAQPVSLTFTLRGRLLSGMGLELLEGGSVRLEEMVIITTGKVLASA